MSFRDLSHGAKCAFIAGQCAARRDQWMMRAREMQQEGLRNMAADAVRYARENSHKVVRFMRAVRDGRTPVVRTGRTQ